MYKEILTSIENIQIWPVVSFCIFFSFFLVLTWWALTVDKKYINEMRQMPLQDDAARSTSNLNNV